MYVVLLTRQNELRAKVRMLKSLTLNNYGDLCRKIFEEESSAFEISILMLHSSYIDFLYNFCVTFKQFKLFR